jgi:hypothetical protein
MLLRHSKIVRSIPGSDMKRADLMQIYRTGNLARLRELKAGDKYEQWLGLLRITQSYLESFISLNEKTLVSSVERARHLQITIESLFRPVTLPPLNLDQSHINMIQFAFSRFETSLEDDLARLPAYIIETIGAYSTDALIASADRVFPASIKAAMPPNAVEDFRKAGACLAFDLSTACGFHAFRSADAMLRQYYTHFAGTTPKKKIRDWGSYIRNLRKAGLNKTPNKRTIDLLDSIREMDRNPVVHPELDLDTETAVAMFDLCKNAITLMAIDIKNAP